VLVERATATEKLMAAAREYAAVDGDNATIVYLRSR
jgi:hypothetical protein